MKKKLIIPAVVVLALAVLGTAGFLRGRSQKYSFRFDTVTVGKLTAFVTATGTVNPVTSIDVGTQVSGIVSKLFADYNSVVKQGQIIAQIDSTFLVQSVKDAQANLYKAQAQLADSRRNLTREKALLDRGLDSQLNYDAALTTNESNEAALKSAEAALDGAKINLAHATIYAPISGVVINRAVNIGQTVAASFSSPTLFTIANDLQKMQVETTVDESDIGMVSIGQNSTFTVDAYPDQTFSGIVSQIRLNPVTIQNVVNYTVIVAVNNDQLKLMPGMTANVRVMVASADNCMRISNMALRFQPPADAVDSTGTTVKAASDSRGEHGAGSSVAVDRAVQDSVKKAIAKSTLRPPSNTTFGITELYPEYEKSPYVPQHQAGRGKLWIVNANGKLEPVFVRTGVTDGRYTEVTGHELKPGEQIVIGLSATSEASSDQARSPLAGNNQQRPMGGGFR